MAAFRRWTPSAGNGSNGLSPGPGAAVDRACRISYGGLRRDPALQDEVQALLDTPVTAQGFLSRPPQKAGPRLRRFTGNGSASMRSGARSARAEWARCIAPATPTRSRRRDQDPARAFIADPEPAARGSSARRGCSPRSIIPTSRRSTGVEESDGIRRSCWNWSRARRSPSASPGGPIRCRDALAIARQIADALDAAHEQGHRPSRSRSPPTSRSRRTASSRCSTSAWRRRRTDADALGGNASPTMTIAATTPRASSSARRPT